MEIEIEKNPEKRPRIPENTRWRIIGYLEAGMSQHAAAKFYKVTQAAISKLWNKYQFINDVRSKKRPGRPSTLSEETKNQVVLSLEKPYVSSKQVAIEFDLSASTIQRIAHEKQLNFRYYEEKNFISKAVSEKRLEYANLLKNDDFKDFVFSDECYLHLFRNTLGSWTKESHLYIERINPNYALMV